MDDAGSIAAFWVLAVLTVGSALMVAAVRNLIHAVVALIISFVGVAGLYVTLSADFLAVTQVLIYAGAVSVLILFAIVLTPTAARDNADSFLRLPALLLAVVVAFTMALAKRNFVGVLMGIEMMFNAVNLTFAAFSRFVESDAPLAGQVFVVFVITVAAAEAAVALALAVLIYRTRETIDVDRIDLLRW